MRVCESISHTTGTHRYIERFTPLRVGVSQTCGLEIQNDLFVRLSGSRATQNDLVRSICRTQNKVTVLNRVRLCCIERRGTNTAQTITALDIKDDTGGC